MAKVVHLGVVSIRRGQVLNEVVRADRDIIDNVKERIESDCRCRHLYHEPQSDFSKVKTLLVQLPPGTADDPPYS